MLMSLECISSTLLKAHTALLAITNLFRSQSIPFFCALLLRCRRQESRDLIRLKQSIHFCAWSNDPWQSANAKDWVLTVMVLKMGRKCEQESPRAALSLIYWMLTLGNFCETAWKRTNGIIFFEISRPPSTYVMSKIPILSDVVWTCSLKNLKRQCSERI